MTADHTSPGEGQLFTLLRRRWLLLFIVSVLGVLIGLSLGRWLPASFHSTASVLVSPLEGNPYSSEGRGDDLINLETEAQLVTVDNVAGLAQRRLKEGDPGRLRDAVAVEVPPNTQVLNISFTAGSAAKARAGAQAFAESYLEYRQLRAQNVINGRLKKLEDQSARVEKALQNTTRELAGASGTERAYLNQRITAYTNQLGVIDEQANDVRSTSLNAGQVITPAGLPRGPGMQRTVMGGVAGLFVAFILGIVYVVLRHKFDQRLQDADAVENLGLRALASIPPASPGSLALVSSPKSSAADGYRRLRAAVVAIAPQKQYAILVASATPGGTVTPTSSNLAVSLAFAGSPTIMIDATTSDEDPIELFGLRPGKGLSDTLLTAADPATLLIHADPHLRLLPRGPKAHEATHRFSGPRMRETVQVLRRRSEYLVINGSSLHDPDAQALCTFADAVLLVVTRGVTTKRDLIQACVEAERAEATVIGIVVESEPAMPTAAQESRRKSRGDKPDGRRQSVDRSRTDKSDRIPAPPRPEPDGAVDDYWPGPTQQNGSGEHRPRHYTDERVSDQESMEHDPSSEKSASGDVGG